MKNIFVGSLCAAALAVCPLSPAQSTAPKAGDRPPPLKFEKLLQAPPDAQPSWDALKNRVVVLEFWTTWCGPCIAAIPHLNELADHFEGRAIQFIAITDEDEKVVGPFLRKKPIHAWIGLDARKSTFKSYGAAAIPRTVIVGRDGEIAAVTHPTALPREHLEDLLAGRKPTQLASHPVGRYDVVPADKSPDAAGQPPAALFQVIVRPSASANARTGWGRDGLSMIGSKAIDALSFGYGVSRFRMAIECERPDARFDFIVKAPTGDLELVKSWLRQSVETTFGLRTRKEFRDTDVYVLSAGNAHRDRLKVTASTKGSSGGARLGRVYGVNMTLDRLARSLEMARWDWDSG